MQEIRFHGRGGQGTVVAAILLAKAFFSAGYYVQSFPVFGVERRGAPVEAYLRVGLKKIQLHCNVYTPNHVVVQDARLLDTVDITRGLKPGGWILVNSVDPPENLAVFSGFRLAHVDATGIAIDHQLGTRTHPIINTAMIGAVARMLRMPPLDTVCDAVRQDIDVKPEQNIQATKDGFQSVQLVGRVK